MIITTFTYTDKANAKYQFKICIKDNESNTVFQTNDTYKAGRFMSINVGAYNSCTVKFHYNYDNELTAIQTIYYKEV